VAHVLTRNALSLSDALGSTLANIGPAFSLYVTVGTMAQLGRAWSLYALVLAGGVSLVLCRMLGAYARRRPLAGSYVQYVQDALGPRWATFTALLIAVGAMFEFGAVSSAMGRFTIATLQQIGWAAPVPYPVWSLVFIALAVGLAARGVRVAARWALGSVLFEALTLLAVAGAGLARAPLAWDRLAQSLTAGSPGTVLGAIAASFPICFFLFMGWDNPASLAEETQHAPRAVRRSAVTGTVASGGLYLLVTVVLFAAQPLAVTAASSFPVAGAVARWVAPLVAVVLLSSVTSTFGILLAMVNARARVLYGSGRARVLPPALATLSAGGTPRRGILALAAGGTVVLLVGSVFAIPQIVGVLAGIGTLYFMSVYALTAFAFPAFLRRHGERPHPVRHQLVPYAVGAVLCGPMYAVVAPTTAAAALTAALVLVTSGGFAAYAALRPAGTLTSASDPA
jgi:amino acid transporter